MEGKIFLGADSALFKATPHANLSFDLQRFAKIEVGENGVIDTSNALFSVTKTTKGEDGTTTETTKYYSENSDFSYGNLGNITGTVTLLQDVSLGSTSDTVADGPALTIKGNLTLDLKGKTLTIANYKTGLFIEGVAGDTSPVPSLTVKDTGEKDANGNYQGKINHTWDPSTEDAKTVGAVGTMKDNRPFAAIAVGKYGADIAVKNSKQCCYRKWSYVYW